MKKFVVGLSLIFLMGEVLWAQTVQFNGLLRNSVYAYSAPRTIGSNQTELHTRLYQTLLTNVSFKQWGGWQLHLAGRALTDLANGDLSELKRFKAYRLSISKKNLFKFIDFEIGRQFLHPGMPLGSIDGLNLKFKALKGLEWQIYGGVETHLFRSAKIYAFNEAAVLGSQLKLKNKWNNNVNLIYLQKNAHGKLQWQVAGINWSNYRFQKLLILMQAHYDLVNNRLHRFYFSARYRFNAKILFNAYVKQQYPQIYHTSYFQIFEVSRYLISGVSIIYQLNNAYTITGTLQGVQLKEGYGHRFITMLSNRNGSLGLIYETGDLGNQIGALLDYRYQIFKTLSLTFNMNYSRYRFERGLDYESQLANAIGLNYQFLKHWNLRMEYQWLQNTGFKSDQRVLNHISFVW